VYEDDGSTTAYLDGVSHVWTTCNTTETAQKITVTIASHAPGPTPYAAFPKKRAYQIRLPNRAPPQSVSVGGVPVPFVRFGAVLASRTTPPANQWYYSFEQDVGLGAVIDIVGVATDTPLTVEIAMPADAAQVASAMASSATYGLLMRGVDAHANMDLDRSNPDSNSPGPAYLSQLSSVGVALEKMADPAGPGGFGAAVAGAVQLLANATAELGKSKSKRVAYTLDLLNYM